MVLWISQHYYAEVFVNDIIAGTVQVFPSQQSINASLYTKGGNANVNKIESWQLLIELKNKMIKKNNMFDKEIIVKWNNFKVKREFL